MSKWVIDKQFSFCYGHRVWSQKLEHEYCESGDTACKCRHLHGHEGLVHVFLEGETLERGMVTDFKHLGWMKNWIDTWLDHKFIIDINDPMFKMLIGPTARALELYDLKMIDVKVPGTDYIACRYFDTSDVHPTMSDSPELEVISGYTVVDFVPTSENFSRWLYECANAKMSKLGIKVARIDWFETPKSRSSYIA